MKVILIALPLLMSISYADDTDDIARTAIRHHAFYDNGLDHSPAGQKLAIINNANFTLALYMESNEVPETIKLAYALKCLREQLRGSMGKADDSWAEDEVATAKMREQIAANIVLIENRYVEISMANQDKESAEQAGSGQPATRSQSKSEGNDKPQPEAEGRSR